MVKPKKTTENEQSNRAYSFENNSPPHTKIGLKGGETTVSKKTHAHRKFQEIPELVPEFPGIVLDSFLDFSRKCPENCREISGTNPEHFQDICGGLRSLFPMES